MRLDQLRYFVAVAEELSFRRAAARLHVSQPPLSFQIKAIEREVGVMLLNRTTRQVSLTDAGIVLLQRAKRVLALVDETTEEIKAIAAGGAGTLRVGFTISTSFNAFFYHSIYSYRRAFSNVKVTFSEMLSGEQIEALAQDRIDIGFLRWPYSPPAGFTMVRLAETELVLAVHHSHPVASLRRVPLVMVKDEPFISYPASLSANIGVYQAIFRLCERAGFVPRIIQEALEPSLIIGLVAAGLGVAIVPSSLRCIQIPGVLFKPIADEGAASITHYLVHRTEDASPRVRALRDLVQRFCAPPVDTKIEPTSKARPKKRVVKAKGV
jgi:DNA-binding transcriptional LysR family regulator